MAKCPLAEIFREHESTPEICSRQCESIWEEAIQKAEFFLDELEPIDEDEIGCSHPAVENAGQEIVRIGSSAVRHLVLFEDCTSCGEEVQTTNYKFVCPHEEG